LLKSLLEGSDQDWLAPHWCMFTVTMLKSTVQ